MMNRALSSLLVLGTLTIGGEALASSHSEMPVKGRGGDRAAAPQDKGGAGQTRSPEQLSREVKAALESLLAPAPGKR